MSSLRERLEKQKKDLKERGGGYKFFAIKEGVTRLRPLPVGEDKDFAVEAVYFYLGEEIKGVISPHTFGKKCAIMEAYNELSASKDEADRKLAKSFKPGKKFFMPVIRYKDDKGKEIDTENGAKLVILAGGQYQDLIDYFLDETEAGDFTDAKNGYDLKFGRTGKGKMDTEYTVRACKPTPLARPFSKEVYEPEEMLKALIPTYKETKELLERFLKIAPADDDEAEDEKPRPKKKKKKDL